MKTAPPWRLGGLQLDRIATRGLAEQISHHIEASIIEGALQPGGRLPSWRDLAAQLGVSRGTVRAAYEKLVDRGVLVTAGSAGTRVADGPVTRAATTEALPPAKILPPSDRTLVFQMGVPAHDAFPATLWSRLHRQAVQATALWTGYSDPCGVPELRAAIASHVALARGIDCSPDQVIVTSGYRSGLMLALQAAAASGEKAWIEDPAYPPTRLGLELAGVCPVAIPVDSEGIDVARGAAHAPDAALAIVTPGQQAPTGVTLSDRRRFELIDWATRTGAWIIEDDYLAELHLAGRPVDALASQGRDRVIHVGTFSKTLSPLVGLGFLIAPMPLKRRLIDAATWLGAPPGAAIQLALAGLLREGHYLRHLRRMRHLYAQRRQCLMRILADQGIETAIPAGVSVLLYLPTGCDDEALAAKASAFDLLPAPLSPWFASRSNAHSGLLLGITNVLERRVQRDCKILIDLIKS